MSENTSIDPEMVNKLQEMASKGDLNNIVSQIPPEMLQNFASLMGNNSNNNQEKESSNFSDTSENNTNFQSNTNSQNSSNTNNFDFNNIDINMIMKMKSMMDKMGNKNDPTSNLLQSLKPYLRDEKKGKVDQYANLLNMTKLAELFNNNKGG